jgi:manganese oxidase
LPGDYLYGSTSLDDQWLGMWGIFRVPGAKTSDLQPLPDRPAPAAAGSPWPALKPGEAERPAPPGTGDAICPKGTQVRAYNISAIAQDIVYNPKTGDHDPNGVMYVLDQDVTAVRTGQKKPEPLVIRARAGECLKIKLTNLLPQTLPGSGVDGTNIPPDPLTEAADPADAGGAVDAPKVPKPVVNADVGLPADAPFPRGNRVSMHPSLVRYDPTSSDGAAVGYNFDGTAGPGQSVTYTWYADTGLVDTGTNLVDFGDRRGHRHHGLWGGLMIEPPLANWTDPKTGLPIDSGVQADIKVPGSKTNFREFVIDFADGLNLKQKDGSPVPDAGLVDDPEDAGDRSINYSEERFAPRLAADPQTANVFSSAVHGDPATPVFEANRGDATEIRLLDGSDRARAHTFMLSGHDWRDQLSDPQALRRSTVGEMEPGTAFTLRLTGGAGGGGGATGDYLFRDGGTVNQVSGGLWGILRVTDFTNSGVKPLGK